MFAFPLAFRRSGWGLIAASFACVGFGLLAAAGRSEPSASLPPTATSRPATKPAVVTRFYDVSDLLNAPADFDPFPVVRPMGNGGGGGGLFGNGEGFSSPAIGQPAKSQEQSVQELISLLRPPETDDLFDDFGAIDWIMNRLRVKGTEKAHAAVKESLGELRKTSHRPVRIRAHWVLLDRTDLEKLLKPGNDAGAIQTIDPAVFSRPPYAAVHLQGEILCTSGHFVTLGTTRDQGTISDIGGQPDQIIPEAQISVASEGLQLFARALLTADGQSAVLRVQTDWQAADINRGGFSVPILPSTRPSPATQPAGSVQFDQTSTRFHRLATETTIPVGPTVLIGGLSYDPVRPIAKAKIAEKESAEPQLYLFVQVLGG